ncbi:MAG: hypothetical protein KC503_10955 [Myxococcales bacterium]|nr:hypothetical protein [Myxococcales bacterium]
MLTRYLFVVLAVLGLSMASGCKKGGDGGGSTGSGKAAATSDKPKLGDKCKGLGPMDGLMGCDGNIKMFCSSASQYTWKKLGECKPPSKCTVGANKKSITCK